MRYWEELVDSIESNGASSVPYSLRVTLKCALEQQQLDTEFMGLYADGQLFNLPMYGQIVFNYGLSNGFKLKPGYNVKVILVNIRVETQRRMQRTKFDQSR